MGMMLNNIKEGGVSLIGSEQPFTHDHFRKSFIRRNKNPVINEKAHTLRALQSTLKVSHSEAQVTETPVCSLQKVKKSNKGPRNEAMCISSEPRKHQVEDTWS